MDERACESVGIDLGTTYSSLAYMDSQLTPRVVPDSSGQAVVPSVIFFEDEEVIVGDIALQNAKVRADRVVQFIKVHMGDEWNREIQGRSHTPESLSAMILAHLVREAEPQIGPIRSAVITVPAFFTEKRRRATQQAGEIAGLKVIGTLNEPMAAALAYGLYREKKEQIALVYDLGGGTFDVTIVRITPSELEELVTCGNRQLGGKDWDQCLIDHVVAEFRAKHQVDPTNAREAMQNLQLQCEQAKRRLSKMAKTNILFNAHGHEHPVEVTREQFEAMTAHLLRMTKLTTEMALEDAGYQWNEISRVVLVGGSTHMPMVRQMLKESSGFAPDTGVNPVIAVALGAATYAHMLETGQSPKTIHQKELPQKDFNAAASAGQVSTGRGTATAPPAPEPGGEPPRPQIAAGTTPPIIPMPKVRFVTAHGVGVKALDRQQGMVNVVLITKNQRVPASKIRRFRTRGSGSRSRRLKIEVTQGDSTQVDLVETLGTLCIEGLPPNEPEGQPVDVTLTFDDQGRLHVTAEYVPTKQSLQLSLDIPGCLREEQVKEFRKYMREVGLIRATDDDGTSATLAI